MTHNKKDVETNQNAMFRVINLVQEMVRHEKKQLHWSVGLKVVLLVFICIYMGWAYANVAKVDADLLMYMAREKINESIPAAKTEMVNRLSEVAPSVIDQLSEGLLDNVPTMEKNLETAAKAALIDLVTPLEEDFIRWLSGYISTVKTTLDEMIPYGSSYEKITMMRKYALDDLRAFIEGISYEIGDSVRKSSFMPELRRLADGKDLTEKEQLQRDIIALWYVLVKKKLAKLDLKSLDITGQLIQ